MTETTTSALTIDVVDPTGAKTGTVELPAEIFDVEPNIPLMHQVVVAQLPAARQGSTRAPQFVGGGTVHGPQPRDYSQRTPKKMKAAALRCALSDRARNARIHVITEFVTSQVPSTKSALAALRHLTSRKRALVVVSHEDDLTRLSLRNVPEVHLLSASQLNTYDVLKSDDVVFTASALEDFLGRGKEESK